MERLACRHKNQLRKMGALAIDASFSTGCAPMRSPRSSQRRGGAEHGGGTKADLREFRHTLGSPPRNYPAQSPAHSHRFNLANSTKTYVRIKTCAPPIIIKRYGWPCVTTTAPLRLATTADNAVSLERLALRDLLILYRVRGRRRRGHARAPLARERKLPKRVHRSADMIEHRPDLHSALHDLCGSA